MSNRRSWQEPEIVVEEEIDPLAAIAEPEAEEICPECGGSDLYLTSYCNFPHCVSCGEGVDHEECWVPPEALQAERDGDLERAREILERRG